MEEKWKKNGSLLYKMKGNSSRIWLSLNSTGTEELYG